MLRLSRISLLIAVAVLVGCGGDEPIQTPAERAEYEAVTSHDELVRFVDELDERSDLVTARTLGRSVEDRRIPYLEVSSGSFGDEDKPIVLIYAQQHGNEPSGKEAALTLLRDVAAGQHADVLQEMDLLVVPQVNPDGGEAHERRNANDVDLNRSHLILDGTEVRHLRDLFHEWEPEVTVDVHEYQPWSSSWIEHGYIQFADEQYGLPTNLNTPAPIRSMAEEDFLPYVREHIEEAGFTFHNYLVGDPDYIRYSTSNINDGRQGMGILNTFSLILEGRNAQGYAPAGNLDRRVGGQVAALEGLLHFVRDHAEEIRTTVRQSRREMVEGNVDSFVLTMDRASDGTPLTLPALEVQETGGNGGQEYEAGDTLTVEIEEFYPRVVVDREVSMPEGYLVPAEQSEIIQLLQRHSVDLDTLEAGRRVDVEQFQADGFTEEEYESTTTIPTGSLRETTYETQAGDVFVPTTQLRGRMVATALEPQSMHGLAQYDAFDSLLTEGPFPIMRVRSM